MEIYQVIKRPLVTEKTTLAREANKYHFEVDRRANKIEIGQAVEKLFKVKVVNVRTMNMAGKKKRVGRVMGRKRDWKKAIVTLAPGSSIEIFQKV
ncbi:MAG TPA: 50S ribosomal protein L23 [Syntrophales bacterium]|nr:50S ribosomal protein L23 [Syntrophales bacterium]HOX95536.1 50S ribosomal protein L23 [Syntrophales bacterium]HPI57337.1 50S ribosomal protein L23 [Syntrophales bacterium]HPN25217.1 50S ribosomal protein L23 [Syntrophales bacterium]HQM29364.1 50S ribosomal protein L23 [Syntrophales bacterium]